jgi:RHS repeat-associated protein
MAVIHKYISVLLVLVAVIGALVLQHTFQLERTGQAYAKTTISPVLEEPTIIQEAPPYFKSTDYVNAAPPNIEKRTYIYAGTLAAAKSSLQPTATDYYIQDHLSSTRQVRNGVMPKEEDTYYAFGETSSLGSSKNDYKYTGKELDLDSGLYYYGARYYTPEFGRFTQPDPTRGKLEDPTSLNRYSYVKNNPLKYVDPTGNKEISAQKVVIYNINGQTVKTIDNPAPVVALTGYAAGPLFARKTYENGDSDVQKVMLLGKSDTQWVRTTKTVDDQPAEEEKPPEEKPPEEDNTPSVTVEGEGGDAAVELTWTSPGAHGDTGTATQYALNIYTTPPGNNDAQPAYVVMNDMPKPQPPPAANPDGTMPPKNEKLKVKGLKKGTTYYFKIKSANELPDDNPNKWGQLSNLAAKTAE